MSEKQALKSVQVSHTVTKLLSGPILSYMPRSAIEKLIENTKNQVKQHQCLNILFKQLGRQDNVLVRLKCWVLVHYLISQKVIHETVNLVENTVEEHEERIRHQLEEKTIREGDLYFVEKVQLPYVVFLKKLVVWKMLKMATLLPDSVDIAFSELNKITQILQLKKIFHNYSCYYPTHEYSLNLFEACLYNIKVFWTKVCFTIKDITIDALENNQIQENQYLLVKEAERVQELLIEFVYGEKMCLKLPKHLRIRQVNLVKPEVDKLESKRKRKASLSATMEVIEEKKIRKVSMGTIDTDRSHDKMNEISKMSKFHYQDQKLDTDVQIQILDTIHELENLIEY